MMMDRQKKDGSSSAKIITNIVLYSRREGSCPLQYALIREVLGYIHDHLRFIITRHGLADDNEIEPVKLSIYAILNARYMDDFKAVLLGQSFRERTWPIVKSSRAYDDIEPWLKANRCPYIYDAETVKTASEYGIYRYASGDMYEGEWRNGKLMGQGKYTYADGDIHEGGYKDDKRRGQGKYICVNGDAYEGCFKNSKHHGQGKYSYANGTVYEGCWKYHKKHGVGKMTYADGTVFEGLWIYDSRSNQGKLTWPDGSVYEGVLNDRQRHGSGKQTWHDGATYIGDWQDDKMHGHGKLTCPDGRVYEGEFINNEFVDRISFIYE